LGQSSGLLICSKHPILSEKHHIFQQRRKVTAKGWLEAEAKVDQLEADVESLETELQNQLLKVPEK